jgi:hypothetical protein
MKKVERGSERGSVRKKSWLMIPNISEQKTKKNKCMNRELGAY